MSDYDFINTLCNPDTKLFFIAIPKTGSTYTDSFFSNVTGKRYFSGGHCVCQNKPISYYDRAWNTRCLDNHNLQNSVPFSVIRNPFDLLVSMYVYGFPYYFPGLSKTSCAVRSGKDHYWPFSSFEDFCIKYCDPDFPWIVPPQKNFLYFQLFDNSGNCVPKFLIRQEKLKEGLEIMSELLNIQPSKNLNYRRSRTTRHDYKKFYDKKLIDLVTEKCTNELSSFGYTFEGHDDRIFINSESIRYDQKENAINGVEKFPIDSPNILYTDHKMMKKDFHPYKLRSYSSLELLEGIYSHIYVYLHDKLKIPLEDLGGGPR